MNLSYRIQKPVAFVLDYLTDMQKFVSIHPVITKMDNLGNNNYMVYETLRIGFIPISFTYPVTVTSDFINKVTIRATVMKLSKIEMVFTLNTVNDFTQIEETIHFKSPLPVKSIMQSIFKKQHGLLFQNMELMR